MTFLFPRIKQTSQCTYTAKDFQWLLNLKSRPSSLWNTSRTRPCFCGTFGDLAFGNPAGGIISARGNSSNLCLLWSEVNILSTSQNGRHLADDIFKHIIVHGNCWILIEISLKFVPKHPIDNNSALVRIIAWHRPGDKQLSEQMMV